MTDRLGDAGHGLTIPLWAAALLLAMRMLVAVCGGGSSGGGAAVDRKDRASQHRGPATSDPGTHRRPDAEPERRATSAHHTE